MTMIQLFLHVVVHCIVKVVAVAAVEHTNATLNKLYLCQETVVVHKHFKVHLLNFLI